MSLTKQVIDEKNGYRLLLIKDDNNKDNDKLFLTMPIPCLEAVPLHIKTVKEAFKWRNVPIYTRRQRFVQYLKGIFGLGKEDEEY